LDKGAAITLSGGNLSLSSTGVGMTRATMSLTSGKWYWECYPTSSTANMVIGVASGSADVTEYTGQNNQSWGYYGPGNVLSNSSFIMGGQASYTTGDTIGVAVDMGAGSVQFYKNGSATGSALTGLPNPLFPSSGACASGVSMTCNFGASSFNYPAPSGFNSGVY